MKNFALLSPRQLEVAGQVALGHSNKRIALLCGVEEGTIKTHVSCCLERLNLRNRAELAAEYAIWKDLSDEHPYSGMFTHPLLYRWF